MNIEKRIHAILEKTPDPLLGLTLNEMSIKSLITIEGQAILIHLTAGFPTDFLQESFLPFIQSALMQALPTYHIQLTLDSFIKAHRTQLTGKGLRGVKNVIAIGSGKGGVGKSTITVNLATSLARAGARVGILDADIYGPSIPLMLGKTQGIQSSGEHCLPIMAHGVQAMSIGYLTSGEDALIWRGPMLAKSLLQLINITLWDELDYLLIDLPPGTGDIQLSLVQKIPVTAAIIVTTPQTVATLDAQKAIAMFKKTGIHVLGVIENMSTHHCSHCGHVDLIFGHGGADELCESHQCRLLGQLPLDARIMTGCDEGRPTAANGHDPLAMAFMKTALTSVIELAQRPLNYADKFPPISVI